MHTLVPRPRRSMPWAKVGGPPLLGCMRACARPLLLQRSMHACMLHVPACIIRPPAPPSLPSPPRVQVILKTLQRYPPVDVNVLLRRAAEMPPCKVFLSTAV